MRCPATCGCIHKMEVRAAIDSMHTRSRASLDRTCDLRLQQELGAWLDSMDVLRGQQGRGAGQQRCAHVSGVICQCGTEQHDDMHPSSGAMLCGPPVPAICRMGNVI